MINGDLISYPLGIVVVRCATLTDCAWVVTKSVDLVRLEVEGLGLCPSSRRLCQGVSCCPVLASCAFTRKLYCVEGRTCHNREVPEERPQIRSELFK